MAQGAGVRGDVIGRSHFGSKRDLYRAVLDRVRHDRFDATGAIVADALRPQNTWESLWISAG